MLPIRSILHPTDFSKRSDSAFHLAAALARDYGARLIALHVLPPPVVVYGEGIVPAQPEGYREELKTKLDNLHATGVPLERRLADGDPAIEILRVAREVKADLIIMGTHGWTGLSRLLMGSVAEQVVRKAPCPVLTIKTPFPAAEVAEKPAVAAEMELAAAKT